MKKSFLVSLFLLTVIGAIFSGCASTESNADSKVDNQNVSSIPWNRPQKWEGGGALGGMMGGQ